MIKGFLITIFTPLFLIAISFIEINAQNPAALNNAETLYKKEAYQQALPLYINIVRQNPKNAVFNHRLGVCYFETLTDFDLAEKHLQIASKGNVTIANLYLGKVYLQLYKFDDAIKYLDLYKKKQKPNTEEFLNAEKLIEQSNALNRMLLATEKVDIIAQMVVKKEQFYKYYNLSKESGLLYQTKDVFEDIDSSFLFFMPERADRLFYPKLSDDKRHTDIYYRDKLIGAYGAEVKLNSNVNSDANELYPFLVSDGITFYFSSQNHGSIGGYDIFVTRYSTETKSFLPPANLGMPFNSLANDYLYIIDEHNNTGWFASDRNNKPDEVTIYKFNIAESKAKVELTGDALRIYAQIDPSLNQIEPIMPQRSAEGKSSNLNKSTIAKAGKDAFTLVLTDKIIYTTINDFKNTQAQEIFRESRKMIARKDSLTQQVAALRGEYSTLPEDQLIATRTKIIAIEDELLYLEPEISKKVNQAKILELQYLETTKTETVEPIVAFKAEPISKPFFIVEALYGIYKEIFTQSQIDTLTSLDNGSILADKKYSFLNVAVDALERGDNNVISNTSFWNELKSIDARFSFNSNTDNRALISTMRHSVASFMMESSKNNYSKFVLYFLKINELYNSSNNSAVKGDLFSFMKTSEYYRTIAVDFFENPSKQVDTVAIKALRDELDKSIRLMEFSFVFYWENKDKQVQPVVDSVSVNRTAENIVAQPIADTGGEVKAEVAPSNVTKLKYKVQLGVFSKSPESAVLEKIPNVLIVPSADGSRVKMYAGEFESASSANAFAKEYSAIGFAGAFVVPFLGDKPLSKSELLEYQNNNK